MSAKLLECAMINLKFKFPHFSAKTLPYSSKKRLKKFAAFTLPLSIVFAVKISKLFLSIVGRKKNVNQEKLYKIREVSFSPINI